MERFPTRQRTLAGRRRILVANLIAIPALWIFASTVLAQQDGRIHRYQQQEHSQQEAGWLSRQRWELALAWIFSPSKFKEQWPRYGYPYHAFHSSCGSESLQRYDIGSGALAIPRIQNDADSESAEYIGLTLAGDTRPEDVESFLGAVADRTGNFPTTQAPNAARVQDGNGEREVVRMHEICGILSSFGSDTSGNLVVVTQHPIPGISTDLRLTELDATSP